MNKFLVMAALMLVSAVGYAQAPGGMKIQYAQANGSGCPAGSAFIDVSPDQQVFTAIFSQFQASIGPNVNPVERNKYCAMVVNVTVPPGWQYSVFKTRYEGWYDLERNVELRQTSKYWFQGNSPITKTSTFRGPSAGTFNFEDQVGVTSWSPCGGTRNMIINANLVLSNSRETSKSGIAGIDSIEGAVDLKYHYFIQYRQCQ